MKRLVFLCALALALALGLSASAYAQAAGDQIHGSLTFTDTGDVNYFDPANGFVPDGSSGIQPDGVITPGGLVEFLSSEGFEDINVDLNGITVLISEVPVQPFLARSWDIYLTEFDEDITGIVLTSSTFPELTWSPTDNGHGLHVHYPGGDEIAPPGWQALFTFSEASNQPPVAEAGGPYTGTEGSPITLDASASSDPDGDALTYAWDLDNDGSYDDATGVSCAVTFPDDGDLHRRSRGDRHAGATGDDTAQVTVDNVAPTVNAGPDAVLKMKCGGMVFSQTRLLHRPRGRHLDGHGELR